MSQTEKSQTSAPDHGELHARLLSYLAEDLSGELTFPTSLDMALRMKAVLSKPKLSVELLTHTLYLEPVIASRLIRLANAISTDEAQERKQTPVHTLREAIETLGVEHSRTVALGVAMDQIMKADDLEPFSHYAQLTWEHSLKTALHAKTIAARAVSLDPEEAKLAGLVHDIGIYYLFYRASKFPEYREDHAALVELVLGWHESISESVLDALGFPVSIVEGIREHDQPREMDRDPRTLNEVIYIANLLAGSNWEWLPHSITPQQIDAVERTKKRFSHLLPEVESRVRMMLEALR